MAGVEQALSSTVAADGLAEQVTPLGEAALTWTSEKVEKRPAPRRGATTEIHSDLEHLLIGGTAWAPGAGAYPFPRPMGL